MRRNLLTTVAVIAVITALSIAAHATTYKCNGKEVTKGDVVITLAKDPKADCSKEDKVMLDPRRGTIKNIPKD